MISIMVILFFHFYNYQHLKSKKLFNSYPSQANYDENNSSLVLLENLDF